MNLSDLSSSPYLASDDYPVGHLFPPVEIVEIKMCEVPVPNSTKKSSKAVAFFRNATKGWCINKTVARQIAKIVGQAQNIEKTWIGVRIQLVVVGDVRRPDGTKGNAFRLNQAWPAGTEKSSATQSTEEAKP
jgi:hypothetical protein